MAILPNKLFFRHLPDGYTRDDLAELAVDFGPVVQVDVPLRWKQDPKTGEWAADNRGCGFVTYASEADALNAMTTLNRLKVYRKTLTVKLARENDPNNKHRKLYIGNPTIAFPDQDALEMYMLYFGQVEECKLVTNKHGGRPFAFVTFAEREEAERALHYLCPRNCYVLCNIPNMHVKRAI